MPSLLPAVGRMASADRLQSLAKAIALDPQLKSFSVTDPDLEAYRDKPWFQELTSFGE